MGQKETKEKDNRVKQWIELAFSDLTASSILYESRQYRTSYFLFQQAVEKANKSLALYIGYTEKELKQFGHDQFKIHSKSISRKEVEISELIQMLDRNPKAKNHKFLKPFNFEEYRQSLQSRLMTIHNLWDSDLVYISAQDIDFLLDELYAIDRDFAEIKIPQQTDPEFKELLLDISDFIGKIEVQPGEVSKKEFDAIIHQKDNYHLLYIGLKQYFHSIKTFARIESTFIICAFLTIQHSSLTRYIENNKNPLKIYTKRLPLVKKQMEIISVFYKALSLFKEQVNSGNSKV